MAPHTIVCKNCDTTVARTPNGICIKCKAPNWGYPLNINTGQSTAQQSFVQTGSGVAQQAVGQKIVCKNCNTVVTKTADSKCMNCGRMKWGYTDAELRHSGGIAPLPRKRTYIKYIVGIILLLAIGALGWWYFKFQNIDVFEKYHKSVVLLYSEYTYKISVNNESMYFSYNEIKNKIYDQTSYADSVKPMTLQGTGFFIDSEGRIITNRHVAHHLSSDDEENCKTTLRTNLQEVINVYSKAKDEATNNMNVYSAAYLQSSRESDTVGMNYALIKYREFETAQANAENNKNTYQSLLNGLSTAKFDVQILFIGYANDGSTVESKSDFKACHLLSYSKDPDIDLAIIQSNDHKLPEGVNFYIPTEDVGEKSLKVDDDVSLIGYNMGTLIGNTKTGYMYRN